MKIKNCIICKNIIDLIYPGKQCKSCNVEYNNYIFTNNVNCIRAIEKYEIVFNIENKYIAIHSIDSMGPLITINDAEHLLYLFTLNDAECINKIENMLILL